jgi:hypothetical protein
MERRRLEQKVCRRTPVVPRDSAALPAEIPEISPMRDIGRRSADGAIV